MTFARSVLILLLVFLVSLLGGILSFYFIALTAPKPGATITEKITEKQVYLESSQPIVAAQSVTQNLLTIISKEQAASIDSYQGKMEIECFNGEGGCARLGVILTSDGLILSGADLSQRDLSEWIALDYLGNRYQLTSIGQLAGANLYQLVKEGELILPLVQRARFLNLKPVLLSNLEFVQPGQRLFSVKTVYEDQINFSDGQVVSKLASEGVLQDITADKTSINLRFNQNLESGVIFDLSGQLVAIRLANGTNLLADQIASFLKRYSINKEAFDVVNFGIKCLDLDKAIAKSLDLTVDYGCLIADGIDKTGGILVGGIAKDSIAEKAGLKPDDIILEVDNKSLVNARLIWLLMNKATGERLDLVVLRAGKTINLSAAL